MTAKSKVAIVTQELDPHAEAVMGHLGNLGVQCVRFHPFSLLSDWQISVDLDVLDDSCVGVISSGRRVKFSELRSVYYRKPDQPNVVGTDESIDRFRFEEACGARDALFQLFDALWFNNPFIARRSGHKLYQMHIARKFGLLTPRTLMTNQPELALEFVRREPGQCAVIKPLGGFAAVVDGRVRQCKCRKVTLSDLLEMESSISASPVILQQYLPKRRDLRVTVINESVVACAIHSQEALAATVDWRNVPPDLLRHEIVDLSPELVNTLRQLQVAFQVPFGAIDLVEDRDGQFWFLENNLNGQWLWIEHLTGYPLARTMATALANHAG